MPFNNRARLQCALSVVALFFFACVASTRAKAQNAAIPRAELPRPDFARENWQTLNGRWEFEFDDADRGLAEGWYKNNKPFSRSIIVPYAFQTKLSGIGDTSFHDVVWYHRAIQIPENFRTNNKRVLINFGAVDYEAIVWINGERVGAHRGGNAGFSFDITDYLKSGDNTVVLRAFDPSTDRTIPRGKQYWKLKPEVIWYTRTSGIWQSVWIEAVAPTHIERLRITPDVDTMSVRIETILSRAANGARLRFTATLRGEMQAQTEIAARASGGANPQATLKLDRQEVWSPENPVLYDLTVELLNGQEQTIDRITSYFGQRKVSVHEGKIYLNNAPYYLRLILDQGYWSESLLTPPSDEAMQFDIRMAKACGLNGARKHQKVEDPR
jgi:beta-galactosidase/beta-glucuronidase